MPVLVAAPRHTSPRPCTFPLYYSTDAGARRVGRVKYNVAFLCCSQVPLGCRATRRAPKVSLSCIGERVFRPRIPKPPIGAAAAPEANASAPLPVAQSGPAARCPEERPLGPRPTPPTPPILVTRRSKKQKTEAMPYTAPQRNNAAWKQEMKDGKARAPRRPRPRRLRRAAPRLHQPPLRGPHRVCSLCGRR